MNILEHIHQTYVHRRRVHVLAGHFAALLPDTGRVLDVGCGDGWLARLVRDRKPGIEMLGIDVLVRDGTHIPVDAFDGHRLPYDNNSFDAVMFVDVLHHTEDPAELLGEATRVARQCVVLKDHFLQGIAASSTLRIMDRISNRKHGVVLPFNYWRPDQWTDAYRELGLVEEERIAHLGLYPRPANWIFERNLHFIARLAVGRTLRGRKVGD